MWFGAVPRELDPLATDLEGPAIAEGLLRCGSGRVVVPEQEPPGLLVPDPHDVLAEERGCAPVVRVVVGVDQVGDLVAHAIGLCDLVDRSLEVMPDARRCIEEDDAVLRCQEGGLIDAIGDPVEVPLDPSDVVALLVEGWPERRLGDRCIVRKGRVGCRSLHTHRILLSPWVRDVGSPTAATNILAAETGTRIRDLPSP